MNNIELSPQFKSQTVKAILSIVLFAIVYLILLAFATVLTVVCICFGIALVMASPRLFTIALGIGIASLGVMIFSFLIKFIFKSHEVDRSHLHEIKESDEPILFEMIHEIVKKVDTHFSQKVYLSSDVNASVFYNSSFWSMFLPIKKNLNIGLGLVNVVTEDELKAILSHEFGHFSQKTMKVGSYVYNVNQVIYNMLYDNESFDNMLQKWVGISACFYPFAMMALAMIRGIQWILKKLYALINKSYMALSREMEFHADEIAANITGHEPLVHSLLRFDLAGHAYNEVLQYYQGKFNEGLKEF